MQFAVRFKVYALWVYYTAYAYGDGLLAACRGIQVVGYWLFFATRFGKQNVYGSVLLMNSR